MNKLSACLILCIGLDVEILQPNKTPNQNHHQKTPRQLSESILVIL